MTKLKVTGTKGHSNAEKRKNINWLMDTLDDIMIGFERIKSPYLAQDDQMQTKRVDINQTSTARERRALAIKHRVPLSP